MDKDLIGKTALITGSGRNIGKATAIELAKRGANVVVNARSNQGEADLVRDEILSNGGAAISVICDVSIESEVKGMFETIKKEFGSTHILVNNAGLRAESNISSLSTQE